MTARAAIFFARDFLADEFSRLGSAMGARPRVYIVMNAGEAARVRSGDPAGEVFVIGESPAAAVLLADSDAINRDRTLRFAEPAEIAEVRARIAATCHAVLARHPEPAFYFDEPVSGYANEAFSREFSSAGALALHFHSTWLPGLMFFTNDWGQARPVPLNLGLGSRALVTEHIAARAQGGALPHYVLSYGKISTRVRDMALTQAKAVYRRYARRGGSYIDRDPEAHRFHAHALKASLAGGYSPDPVGPDGATGAGPMVVFPLHYEPEALLNYFSPYLRQEDVAARLLDTLPPDGTLVLKEHPSQPGALMLPKWRDLVRAGRVVALPGTYPATRLLAARPTVISLGSTFALEAALAGCPTGILGTVHFGDLPGISRITRPEDWVALFDRPTATADMVADWYAAFLARYAFAGNFMRGRTWIEDPEQLIAALGMAAGDPA